MTLAKPALHELRLQQTCLDLMEEFLGGFFDGQPHNVGGNPDVKFPQAELRFQQAAHSQPLNGVGIALVWTLPTRVEKRWEPVNGVRQYRAYAWAHWTFWVRAASQSSADGPPARQVQTASDLLAGLLANTTATRPLHQKGLHHLRPGLPQVMQDTHYALRMVPCRVHLRYPVLIF